MTKTRFKVSKEELMGKLDELNLVDVYTSIPLFPDFIELEGEIIEEDEKCDCTIDSRCEKHTTNERKPFIAPTKKEDKTSLKECAELFSKDKKKIEPIEISDVARSLLGEYSDSVVFAKKINELIEAYNKEV